MLRHIDGFDQFQGQSGSTLLGSLTAAGYTVSQGLAMAEGRHAMTHALELQLSPGAAGLSWSRRTNNIKSALQSVAVNPASGRWIAVGDKGVAATSADTITWSTLVMGVTVGLKSICFADGRWIAVGEQGTILVSDDDGASWQTKAQPLNGPTLNAVAYGDGKFVIAGQLVSAGAILVSTDKGDTWAVVVTNAGPAPNRSVAYGGGGWVVGGNGGQVRISTDAVAWATGTFGVTSTVTSASYGDGVWMAPSGRTVRQSTNGGSTWAEVANSLGTTTDSFTSILYSAGRWVIAGAGSKLMTSDNRTEWMTRPLTGGNSSTPVNDIALSDGPASGLIVVGGLIGSGGSETALIFASLAPPTTIRRTFVSTANTVVIGFAHRATSRGRIMSVSNLFDLDWPGGLSILGQDSTAIPIRNAWYYYELVINKTARTLSLFVNDTTDIVVPLPEMVSSMDNFECTWVAENGAVARIDDLYLLDSDAAGGSTLVERLRPIRIPLRVPTADSDVNWEGSAAGPHSTLVGLLPPSDSNYVRSAESGAQELFTSNQPLPPSASVVLAVGVLALAKKSDLDNRQLGLAVGPAGETQREVIDTTLSVNPEYSLGIFEKGPGDAPWTPATVLTSPFGVIVRP